MKKFLIFLVAIVVCVSVGVMAFYFFRNDEVISVEKSAIELNAGDFLETTGTRYNSIGMTVQNENRRTSYGYRVETLAGVDITDSGNVITYDEASNTYKINNNVGGEYVFVLTTTNSKYPEFKVKLHIGDGSVNNPYFVRFASDLFDEKSAINLAKNAKKSYKLINDIDVGGYANAFTSGIKFSGNFDGNGKTISNTLEEGKTVAPATIPNAGLFGEIEGGAVKDLTIKGAVINGEFDTAGVLAGKLSGETSKVTNVRVQDAYILNTKETGITGGLIGEQDTASTVMLSSVKGTISLGVAQIDASPYVGGLIGKSTKATIKASYAQITISGSAAFHTNMGGLVGAVVLQPATATDGTAVMGKIYQSYAVVAGNASVSSFIGNVSATGNIVDGTGSDFNTFSYSYFVGNYATNLANARQEVVGSYDTNSNTIKTNAEKPGATMIGKMSEETKFIYYKTTQWDGIWDNITEESKMPESTAYPELKIGVDSSRVTNPSYSYIASTTLVKSEVKPGSGKGGSYTEAEKTNVTSILTSEIIYALNKNISFSAGDANDLSDIVVDLKDAPGLNYSLNRSGADKFMDFRGATIIIKNSMFNYIENLEIANVVICVDSVNTTDQIYGGLAKKARNVQLKNVIVKYAYNYNNADHITTITNSSIKTFGGVVGVLLGGQVENCFATGINIGNQTTSSAITTAGGVFGTNSDNLDDGKIVVPSTVTFGYKYVPATTTYTKAGTNEEVTATIPELKIFKDCTIQISNFYSNQKVSLGGVAGDNASTINSSKSAEQELSIGITVNTVGEGSVVAGVAASSTGSISNLHLKGNGISYAKSINVNNLAVNDITFAGAVGTLLSPAKLENVYNYSKQIGSELPETTTNYKVAGLIWANNSTANNCIVASDLYGNIVAGLVGVNSGNINGAMVVGANWKKNVVYGEKDYFDGMNLISATTAAAGVAYEINNGKVENFITNSKINAGTSSCQASLTVLNLPRNGSNYGVLRNGIVNNKFIGNISAKYYRDTNTGTLRGEGNRSLYNDGNGTQGRMYSVVINTETITKLATGESATITGSNYRRARYAMSWSLFGGYSSPYTNDNGNFNPPSYMREVNSEQMKNSATFSGTYEETSNSNNVSNNDTDGKGYGFGSKTLTFDTTSNTPVWVNVGNSNFGIMLNFATSLTFLNK